jgi:hypothetical protein
MSGKRKSKPVVVRGSQVLTFDVAASNSSVVIALSPATFTRTNSLQASFEFYRFVSLKAELLPATQVASTSLVGASTSAATLGYLPEELTATSTTITQASASQLEAHVSHTLSMNGSSAALLPETFLGLLCIEPLMSRGVFSSVLR